MTKTDDDGKGSLRQAIKDAATATDDVFIDLRHLPQPSVITLTSGTMYIPPDHPISLAGPGADLLSISGNLTSGIFSLNNFTSLSVSDITLRDGRSTGGGAVQGISGSNMLFSRVAFRNNKTTVGGGTYGGAVRADGESFFFKCIFQDNEAGIDGGALYLDGSGTKSRIIDSTFVNNKAVNGGAISIGSASSTITVVNGTFTGNSAASAGGAIDFNARVGRNSLSIVNSTIANNSANIQGGGIYNRRSTAIDLANTIVANNTTRTGTGPDIYGDILSQGHNLVGYDSNTTGLNFSPCGTSPADLKNVDPKLSPLRIAQAGDLPVLVPALDSPAVNAITIGTGACDGNNVPGTDQRGISRPQGGRADIGAVEVIGEDDRIFCSGVEGLACKLLP